ncbi:MULTISPECIES: Holliday junction resolvase RuvX [unclassified Acinetobacter]|uniref:Holliday junction resolvase RuvX n=1 Tax=unclassified Acinetobacter TaxID=196816 RepID=UPI0035B771EC
MQFDINKVLEKTGQNQGHLTVMAFDFGTQKMGVAVGQKSIHSSQALALFPMQDGIPHWENLFKIIHTWQPDLFLVGLPLNMDDSESELSLRARKFARRLRHQGNIATFMVDERLSTREARDRLDDYQAQGMAKKIAADSIAASILLENWYAEPLMVLQP